jgi:hypothetical protein
VCEVEEAGCVECGVGGMWWEGEREAGCYEAVEGCVEGSMDIGCQLLLFLVFEFRSRLGSGRIPRRSIDLS